MSRDYWTGYRDGFEEARKILTRKAGGEPRAWMWYGGVYFISKDRAVKIGYSNDVRSRLKRIARTVPGVSVTPLGFIYCKTESEAQSVERQHHERFGQLRIGASEWFDDDGSIAAYATECSTWPRSRGRKRKPPS